MTRIVWRWPSWLLTCGKFIRFCALRSTCFSDCTIQGGKGSTIVIPFEKRLFVLTCNGWECDKKNTHARKLVDQGRNGNQSPADPHMVLCLMTSGDTAFARSTEVCSMFFLKIYFHFARMHHLYLVTDFRLEANRLKIGVHKGDLASLRQGYLIKTHGLYGSPTREG